ncbi:MAG TPA: ACP synthase, partial [Acinetobacter sp.]|nr:ACP synthase [Acinetobacter sp.]
MTTRKIEIHVQALAQLIKQSKPHFLDLKSFNHYKKEQIKNYRNCLLADYLHCSID